LGRFKSAQRLVDAIRELNRQIRLTEESGMTVDQAVMVMSVLDTTEPDIREVIASVINKLSGNVPDNDPDPTPDPETPDTPEPEPETEPETPDEPEPESNEETPVESEDSETAEAVDESPEPEPETPEATEDASEASEISTVDESSESKTIMVDGCIHPVTVTKDGEVFINGEKQEVLYNTQGYAFLKLPGEKRLVRVILHSLVMQAFRPTTSRKQVVHKNGNQRDCRLENLAYRDEIKMDNPTFDATDALEASLALVDTNFNVGEAVNLLGMRKKRASYDLVRKVMNKEIFSDVSDRYFDARLHVVQDVPKTESVETTENETTTTETTTPETVEEIKEKMEEKTSLIEKALADSGNKIRDAYKLLVKQGHPEISLYEIFNVKNGGAGDPPDDDVVELIKYAKKGGSTDIRYTLLSECNLLNVSQRQFNKATRGR
jgi:hypothetical protein